MVVGLSALPATAVLADDAPPSEADLAAAKKAFGEGKKLFDKKKYAEAVEKFKESYRLSKNPLLLYNIALTFEKLDNVEKALFYYRKFLKDAPEDAAQRADAEASVKDLERRAPPEEPPPDEPPVATDPPPPDPEEPTETPKPEPKTKRVASYTAADFEHTIVEDAPPGKPLDLTASAPEDAGWTVTLFYRGAGEDKFTQVVMVSRYKELVGRIPADKMTGNAVQYYVEVKDAGGQVIQRIGKSSSPNVVYLDAGAQPRFYPDFDGGGEVAAAGGGGGGGGGGKISVGDEEDPLAGLGGGGGGAGLVEGGDADKPSYLKWGVTGASAGLLAVSVTFYAMAASWGNSLEAEASASHSDDCTGGPPCRSFDDHRKNIEATGQRYETFSKVSFVLGLASGAAAGWLWYREAQAGKKKRSEPSVIAAPAVGDDFLGGTAAIRF